MKAVLAGTSGLYEILLIILVVVLIFNGLLRNRMMKDEIQKNKPKSNKKSPPKIEGGDYVDYEVLDD